VSHGGLCGSSILMKALAIRKEVLVGRGIQSNREFFSTAVSLTAEPGRLRRSETILQQALAIRKARWRTHPKPPFSQQTCGLLSKL